MSNLTALSRIALLFPELPVPPFARTASGVAALPPAIEVPAATTLFEEGHPCRGFPLVLADEIRVARHATGGRSLELYRVSPGELCVVSTAALFGRVTMPAYGLTSQACELVHLSLATFEAWTSHEPFRRYVFGVIAERLTEVVGLATAIAFDSLDQRLAAALLGHGKVMHSTHQALADELGTVREIISRLLRRFERNFWLTLGRERIEIVDAGALRRLARGNRTDT